MACGLSAAGSLQNMADRSGLSGDDLALVLKYLQTQAKTQ